MKMNTFAKKIVKAEMIALVVIGVWAYSKQQYYQGRVDAVNEMKDKVKVFAYNEYGFKL